MWSWCNREKVYYTTQWPWLVSGSLPYTIKRLFSYHLVMTNSSPWKSPIFDGKTMEHSLFQWPFSMANYEITRGYHWFLGTNWSMNTIGSVLRRTLSTPREVHGVAVPPVFSLGKGEKIMLYDVRKRSSFYVVYLINLEIWKLCWEIVKVNPLNFYLCRT